METLFNVFILYPLLFILFWECFLAELLGVSVWAILGIRFGSDWALKNFSPRLSKATAKSKRDIKQDVNKEQDLFYEDA
tara:strand:- start:2343 stop:2579 length:237 start_codon:yes stop_codon:yes gene_type:complete